MYKAAGVDPDYTRWGSSDGRRGSLRTSCGRSTSRPRPETRKSGVLRWHWRAGGRCALEAAERPHWRVNREAHSRQTARSNSPRGNHYIHLRQQQMMRCCEQQAEVRASFVVGIPSDRSVCIKQVLIEGEAVGGFTPAGKPPPQLLCRSGIRSYGLVCCA